MADPYSTVSDLYAYGLPRGALPNPARLAASVLASSDAFTLDEHGFATDDPVSFRAEAGGALPAPLVAGTTYYAIALTAATFKVAAAAAGAAIDLTTDGTRVLVIAPAPVTQAIAWADRLIDQFCPGHLVPFTAPVPDIIKHASAQLAAGKLLAMRGATSKSIGDLVADVQKLLARWGKGAPVRDANATASANTAASATASDLDPRGWRRFGGIC
jgi:hypothetical protein